MIKQCNDLFTIFSYGCLSYLVIVKVRLEFPLFTHFKALDTIPIIMPFFKQKFFYDKNIRLRASYLPNISFIKTERKSFPIKLQHQIPIEIDLISSESKDSA